MSTCFLSKVIDKKVIICYYVNMLEKQENKNFTIYTEEVKKPAIDNFKLFYGNKASKSFGLKQALRNASKIVLWVILVAFLAVYDAINIVLQHYEQKRLERAENASLGLYRLKIVKS
jgi:hypothetical protein